MEGNIENKTEKRRLSLITDVLVFITILSIFLYVFRFITLNYDFTQNLALESIEISNLNYIEINNIKERYGIDIIFGDETYDLSSRVNGNIQLDEHTVYNNIMEVKKALEKYPDSFFINTKLSIVILDSFNNNNIALATRNRLNEFRIYLTNNSLFERSLHHEMFHIFEYKVDEKVFSNWNDFNPDDFKYDNDITKLNTRYVYDKNVENLDDIYFVTIYSKTLDKEDRAEIFAEIMTYKIKPEYLKEGTNIYNKAKFLTDLMSEVLEGNNNRLLYWNKF